MPEIVNSPLSTTRTTRETFLRLVWVDAASTGESEVGVQRRSAPKCFGDECPGVYGNRNLYCSSPHRRSVGMEQARSDSVIARAAPSYAQARELSISAFNKASYFVAPSQGGEDPNAFLSRMSSVAREVPTFVKQLNVIRSLML